MSNLEHAIGAGLALEREGKQQEAIAHFLALGAVYPANARVIFELGGAYDFAGLEAEAIPHYRHAIALGLPEELQARAALQLGSSLRNIGEPSEAVRVLEDACRQFPKHLALRAFLGLSLYSAGKTRAALIALLDGLLEQPQTLDGYARALGSYTDELRE